MLFRSDCTRYSIEEVKVDGVPQHFAEYERFVEQEDSLQMYTPGLGGGQHTMVFHGHGGAADEANNKRQLEQFCHLINQGMSQFLRNRRVPLVLAAAEPLAGIYRRINQYPRLYEEIIHGNPQRLRPDELLHSAVEVLKGYFSACTRRAAATYHEAAALGKGSKDPKAIVSAAMGGRIDSLLVSLEDHLWGRYDDDTGELITHQERQSGDQDLLDLAASKSMQYGGAVFALQRQEMPDGVMAAATFRYVVPPMEGTQKESSESAVS